MSAVFSSCGKYIASGSIDKSIIVWHLESGKLLFKFQVSQGHRHAINSVSFSSDDKFIVSSSDDQPYQNLGSGD